MFIKHVSLLKYDKFNNQTDLTQPVKKSGLMC